MGPQLITALSLGFVGERVWRSRGEGLFSSRRIGESLTHRFAVPPLPQKGEGCCQLIFCSQAKGLLVGLREARPKGRSYILVPGS